MQLQQHVRLVPVERHRHAQHVRARFQPVADRGGAGPPDGARHSEAGAVGRDPRGPARGLAERERVPVDVPGAEVGGLLGIDHEFPGTGGELNRHAVDRERGEPAARVESRGDTAVGERATADNDRRQAADEGRGGRDAGERRKIVHTPAHHAAARERQRIEEAAHATR